MNQKEKGSVVVYILIAIFMAGLLIAMLSQGAKKHAGTAQTEEAAMMLKSDIQSIQNAVSECVETYTDPTDVDGNGTIDAADNPNPPFPLYGDLTSGGTGVAVTTIKCPGAPAAKQAIFTGATDNKLKILSDTSTYNTIYVTDSTEGIYIRISSTEPDDVWKEAISWVNAKTATCSAAVVTDTGDCTGSCLYYWILRRQTSTIGAAAEGCLTPLN